MICHGSSEVVERNGYQLTEKDLTIDNLHKQARQFWEAIKEKYKNVKKWVIIGHSLGGCLATHLAEDIKDQIEGLVLIDTIAGAARERKKDML